MDVQAVRYQVSFRNGPDLLQGDLVLPAGPGPHPAAVLVGGTSGPRDRGRWVEQLALYGLATLSWDSPGWGASGGWRRWQAPDERTMEVLAAVDLLAGLRDVSPGGIAVVGGDAGAWAAALAAALSRRIQGLVLLAPPCTNPHLQELHRLGQRMSGCGFIAAEVGLAQLVLAERIRRLAAGEDVASVLRAEAPCRHASWYGWLPGTTPAEVEAFAGLARYQAPALLASVGCPVLGIYGTDDPAIDTWRDAQALRLALAAAPGSDRHVLVLPRSDEAFVPPGAPGWTGPREPGDRHHELVACAADWLAPRLARNRLIDTGAIALVGGPPSGAFVPRAG